MKFPKLLLVIVALVVLLIISLYVKDLFLDSSMDKPSSAETGNYSALLQYEWPQFQGDPSFTRFSAGPAPDTSSILWKANITGIQSYIAAFDGMIFVCTNTSVVALDKETGNVLWKTNIPMPRTWPVAYKIDDEHMVVESSCLDPKTGDILWTSSTFSADTGIFNANVYSPEEKMFYTKVNSYVEAWSFSGPSNPPTLAWTTYIPGGGRTGSGLTYGDGKVFPGSFQSHQMVLDAKTGAVLWDTAAKGPMIFSGSYYQGRFLRGGTDDNTMYCFNATNGEILWTYTPDTDGYFTVGSAVAYGMVYELNKDGYLYAFDIESGNLVWKYKGPGPLLFPGSPTVADGKVYATTGQAAQYGGLSSTSEFACLDAYTGELIWKLPIEAFGPRESVAVAYGYLYLIPGNVTTSIDSISGSEYATIDEVWAIGTSSSLANSSWPMWRHDPAHSSIGQGGPSNLTLAWKFTTNGAVISSPSVADGIVYVGSQDKNIYALGAWSGSLIWNFTTLALIESSPAVANGKVYTGGEDGYVYCLDAYNGSLLWKTFVNGDQPATFGSILLRSSPAISGDIVCIGSMDGYLYALDANNGNVKWKAKTEGPIASSPAVADGAVYITSQEPTTGALYKLDANNGSLIWKKLIPYQSQFTGGTDMLGSPSVAAGMVFASSNLREYYGINATTGDTEWAFTDPASIEFIFSSPIYVNGKLFIIDKYNIACLNATNGHTIWSFFTGDELFISPSYSDGKLYVVTSQRHIYILDAINNGTKLASFTTPSSSWSSPTISYGRLYVGNNDWNVYCLAEYPAVTVAPTSPPSTPPPREYIYAVVIVLAAMAVVLLGYAYVKRRKK
jgi:outer membrane protein assembly factor BamB